VSFQESISGRTYRESHQSLYDGPHGDSARTLEAKRHRSWRRTRVAGLARLWRRQRTQLQSARPLDAESSVAALPNSTGASTMCGKLGWPNSVWCAESTDSSGTRRRNSDSSKWRLLVQTLSDFQHVNLEFRLLLTEDYYITIQLYGRLSQVAYRHKLTCPVARTAVHE